MPFAPDELFCRHVVAPLWARWERSPYLKHYRQLKRQEYDPAETLRERQLAQLQGILRHADRSCPYWRDIFRETDFDVASVKSLTDLRRLPILSKNDIRTNQSAMQAAGLNRADWHTKTTSGSTGVSLEILVDEDAMQWKRAFTLKHDEWTGWRLGQRIAAVWGNPEYLKYGLRGWLRNTLLDRKFYLDTLHMQDSTLEDYLRDLERLRPPLLFGHAHSLYLLARFAESRTGTSYRPRGIISTAMVLHDFERECIERVFHTPVTNRYGCEEVSLIACQCEAHRGLHINTDNVYVEILNPANQPVGPGEPGRIVVTDLVNRAMPLIRYEVGDMASWSETTCSCGRRSPTLERVEGRIADYVTTSDGHFISGISLTENFAVLVTGIRQLQIIQEEIDRLVFRIARSDRFSPASEQQIAELVRERFGPDMRHELEFVDAIAPEPSGKYRFCISRVAPLARPVTEVTA